MRNIILFILLFTIPLFSQVINYSWGETTAGVAYNQIGSQDADSATTISIVFDMQDYYPLDFSPLVSDDSVVIGNSNRQFLGTFWYRIDAQNATDSTGHAIKSYSGNMIYHPNDESRVTTTNINFSSTATTLLSETAAVNDLQWSFVNVYVNSSTDVNSAVQKHLPPEFVKVAITFQTNAADSMDVYWNFAYPAVLEHYQDQRRTSRTNSAARKESENLH